MDLVYRKTERGQAEIATRQHKLGPRLRSALIVVDGKRSDLELATMIATEPRETLQALLEAGFIELANEAAAAAAANAAATAASDHTDHGSPPMAAVPGALPPIDESQDTVSGVYSPGYTPTMPLPLQTESKSAEVQVPAPLRGLRGPARAATAAEPAHNITETKRHAMQWLTDQLGPYAVGVNQRIARCETAEALGSAILVARSVVEQQLGADTALRFESEMFAALRRAVAA